MFSLYSRMASSHFTFKKYLFYFLFFHLLTCVLFCDVEALTDFCSSWWYVHAYWSKFIYTRASRPSNGRWINFLLYTNLQLQSYYLCATCNFPCQKTSKVIINKSQMSIRLILEKMRVSVIFMLISFAGKDYKIFI